ncbi:MAG: hypothetical protein SFV52_03685 [Saprospiraceae bacterium]|nr:hypothetical protein [Saprospiraceae bacterium]
MWTHLEGFEILSASELDALIQAPVLITILVAGADGDIDREERFWTDRLMQTRTYSRPKVLNDFYRVVAAGFLEKLDKELETLPTDPTLRSVHLSEELKGLNAILAKLDPFLAADLYKSYRGLAREAAVSSGGFLRFGAVSEAEAEWMTLPMIRPVLKPKSAEAAETEDGPEWVDWE